MLMCVVYGGVDVCMVYGGVDVLVEGVCVNHSWCMGVISHIYGGLGGAGIG